MNKADLTELIAKSANLRKTTAEKVIGSIISAVTDILKTGDQVNLVGFGSFGTAARRSRVVKKPHTGPGVVIHNARIPNFRPGRALKEAVARKGADTFRGLNKHVESINAPSELIEMVAKSANVSKEVSEKAVDTFFSTMRDALKKGDRVNLIGFGSFETVTRKARTGRNPQTGLKIQIPDARIPRFQPDKILKGAVTGDISTGLIKFTYPDKDASKRNHYTVSVFFGTDRDISDPTSINNFFGNDRSDKFHLGYCDVSIPIDHKIGELEAPSFWKLEFRDNPSKHVVLLKVEDVSENKFYTRLNKVVTASTEKDLFVFIHGFNVTFKEAIRRTAQIAYDLNFKGAPVAYSWPSKGKLKLYTTDETNVEWTINHLKDFLYSIAKKANAKKIHVIAHSMGNRALTNALLKLSPLIEEPLYDEIVLTAPDIDSDVFCKDIVPAIQGAAKRLTLYASSNDVALKLSKEIHGYPRAGDSGEEIIIIPGIDTIDVSAVDTNLLGHSYYGDNRSVISDLFSLIRGLFPDERFGLSAKEKRGQKYWVFNP